MSDAHFYATEDGGEIDFVNGQAVMSDGLEAAAYLSLFGGNEEDSGVDPDEPQQWWGNFGESEDRKQRSRTVYALNTLIPIPANLRQIEDAARQDLAWMLTDVATSIEVTATMPAPRRLELEVEIEIGETSYTFTFGENWIQQ
jgi:phage gp46-like protein